MLSPLQTILPSHVYRIIWHRDVWLRFGAFSDAVEVLCPGCATEYDGVLVTFHYTLDKVEARVNYFFVHKLLVASLGWLLSGMFQISGLCECIINYGHRLVLATDRYKMWAGLRLCHSPLFISVREGSQARSESGLLFSRVGQTSELIAFCPSYHVPFSARDKATLVF